MERVVCYCRVSTEEEKQLNALEKQVEELESFVNSNLEWELVATYIDEGKTGTSVKNRKSYQELYEDLEKDKFTIIVIKDQSRLMRNTMEWYLFIHRVQMNEKRLFLYLDNQFYSPDNAFINGIKAIMAEEYSRDLSRKNRSAARRSQKNARVLGNGLIYGYNQNDATLTVNEAEAVVIRKIYEMYADGIGARKISLKLYEAGHKSRVGKPIATSVIYKILRNPKYKGTYVGHITEKNFETKKYKSVDETERIMYDDKVPAIVSAELWNKCADILNGRRDVYMKKSGLTGDDFKANFLGKFPLSGKMLCGECGSEMWHRNSFHNKNKCIENGDPIPPVKAMWLCKKHHKYGKNPPEGCVGSRVFDHEIMECLKYVLSIITEDSISEEIDSVFEAVSNTLKKKDVENKSENLQDELIKHNKKIDKLLDMCLDDVIDKATFNEKKEVLTAKINDIKKRIAMRETSTKIISEQEHRLDEIKKSLDGIKSHEINIDNQLIQKAVKYVVVTRGETMMIEIILDFNNTPNVNLNTPRIYLFETSYPFLKTHCHKEKEDYKIIVSVI